MKPTRLVTLTLLASSTLDIKSHNLTVAVQNNGYRKMTPGQ